MGYTQQEVDLIGKYIKPGISVLDYGSQNDYTTGVKDPPFISEWYKRMGVTDYTCIDLAGDNNALKLDVSHPVKFSREWDIVVDAGFGEHIVQAAEYETIGFHDGYINSVYPIDSAITDKLFGFYNFWLNKHTACKMGGYIISINPESGSWPLHCYRWITKDFYIWLTNHAGYELVFLDRHAAMGNNFDGWNVVAVIRKIGYRFPLYETFSTFPIFSK